ncbi:ATP-grasp domain-containing protein [Deinococcus sp. SDU3-2]|uniref:ATP-grasp domain-containing protein n=1 Tax=Deinococcus terrestris TaxID=2651870 RepID=A0A7X1NXM6_9DEIO|nr:ATP-grasp domain-containing protein [Deinococcus terrestris]MPY67625.1 ATP-grasp domain-containing protein [Deinococcus terrestris]
MTFSTGPILLTSAGRRVSLLRAWQRAAAAHGRTVLVTDMDPLAPAALLAERAFALPPVTAAGYLPELLAAVQDCGVSLIIPTIDTELPLLARNAGALREAGATPIVSELPFAELCNDKWLFGEAFAQAGLDTPRAWLPAEAATAANLPQDLFIKPRDGSASLHASAVTRDELETSLPRVPNAVVQERLTGQEITVDALLDFAGEPLHYVPRRRIRTVGGESIQGETLDNAQIGPWLETVLGVAGRLGARGPITVQGFLTARGPVLTEINPRFGGGYPLGYAAGAHYPEWLLALSLGQAVQPRLGAYQRGLYMTRHYEETFTSSPRW